MTEYVVIVALVAIGSIAAVNLVGDNVRGLFGASAESISGADAVAPETLANAQSAHRNLQTFSDFNAGGGYPGGPGTNLDPNDRN